MRKAGCRNFSGRSRLTALALAFLAILPLRAAAQDISVDLSADRQELSLGEQFQLTVTVSGTMRSVPEPQLQNMDNFQVVGRGTSSQISIVNGQISATKSTNYTVLPSREGAFSIGPAVIRFGGKDYSSNTLEIKVGGGQAPASPGAAAPKPGPGAAPPRPGQSSPPVEESLAEGSGDANLFIRGSVDKREVYVGEQVTYTFGFYNRLRLAENPEYNPASFNGFWVEELDKSARQTSQVVNGVSYSVQELRYALFPATDGEATIGPAKLAYTIRNAWDFFDNGSRKALQTRLITVKVKPLPAAGKPADFGGAVGKFTIAGTVDKNSVKQGEAVTLELDIAGTGNIRSISEPKPDSLEDFDIYESKSEENIDRSGERIRGKKIFRFVMVPRKEGEYRLPGVAFSFFDPEQEKYITVRSAELALTVLPSGEKEQPPAYHLAPESVMAVGEDIHYIKEAPSALKSPGKPLSSTALFWLLHLLPVVSVGLALLYRRHRGLLVSDLGYARQKGAGKRLERNLKDAARALKSGDTAACYAALDRALCHFIGDRLNEETVGMMTDGIVGLLSVRNVAEDVREEVRRCLEHFAFVRFAPQSATEAETAREYLNKVRKLVGKLDKAL